MEKGLETLEGKGKTRKDPVKGNKFEGCVAVIKFGETKRGAEEWREHSVGMTETQGVGLVGVDERETPRELACVFTTHNL